MTTTVIWPLPDDYVDDPRCTPTALHTTYLQLMRLLAGADPDRHPAPTLRTLEYHCRYWGLPSPLTEDGRQWAREQLAHTPPAGSPREAGR